MTLKAQVLICIVLIIALIAIVNMVRKRSLELKYVLVWICADIILFIFTLTVALSRVTARVRKLAQMIALQDEEKREK